MSSPGAGGPVRGVPTRARGVFLALVLVQAGHSIEEYATRAYDLLPPARFLSGLVSADRATGFAVLNLGLIAVGLGCYLGPIRHAAPAAWAIAWFWVLLEFSNGAAHMVWALWAGAYRPGLATAPLLSATALVLAWTLRRQGSAGS